MTEDASPLKLYMADTGLLATHAFADAAGKLRVSPIEAKSLKNYTTVSLDDFKRKCSKKVGEEVVLHTKQLSVVGNRVYLPLSMSGLTHGYLVPMYHPR